MKTIFWHQGCVEVPCTPCPFLGIKIKDSEEFKTFVKTKLYRKGYPDGIGHYPCVIFDTKYPQYNLVFRGSVPYKGIPINPLTEVPFRWWLEDENHNVIRFFSERSFDVMFEHFPDSEDVDKEIEEIENIIRCNGVLKVQIL